MADRRELDDVALLRLLWRGQEAPSTRTGLSVDAVVGAGIEVADEAGYEALSMRRVAERLGVGAMSLYTYVPGKQALVELMVDQVHGEVVLDADDAIPWRERLAALAARQWELHQRHPWLLDVPIGRPAIGPHVMDLYEQQLGIVDGLGLDELEMNAAVELVLEHVVGAARRGRGIRQDAAASGVSDDEWWYRIRPTLEQVLADRHYPLSERVGGAIGAPHLDTSYLLGFGLDRILDGLEALVEARHQGGAPPTR